MSRRSLAGGIAQIRKRMFGSVRVRVAVVAWFGFATALVAGSVLLLHTLESRLVDNIRSADETALQSQRLQLLSAGLPSPSATTGPTPVLGAGTVTYVISDDGHPIVATALAGHASTS